MDIFPKFIIETDNELGDCLIISKCTYHRDIATDIDKVKGGGWFKLSSDKSTMTLHGSSDQFGTAKLEDIQKIIKRGNVYTNPFLTHSVVHVYKFVYDTGTEIIKLDK